MVLASGTQTSRDACPVCRSQVTGATVATCRLRANKRTDFVPLRVCARLLTGNTVHEGFVVFTLRERTVRLGDAVAFRSSSKARLAKALLRRPALHGTHDLALVVFAGFNAGDAGGDGFVGGTRGEEALGFQDASTAARPQETWLTVAALRSDADLGTSFVDRIFAGLTAGDTGRHVLVEAAAVAAGLLWDTGAALVFANESRFAEAATLRLSTLFCTDLTALDVCAGLRAWDAAWSTLVLCTSVPTRGAGTRRDQRREGKKQTDS